MCNIAREEVAKDREYVFESLVYVIHNFYSVYKVNKLGSIYNKTHLHQHNTFYIYNILFKHFDSSA